MTTCLTTSMFYPSFAISCGSVFNPTDVMIISPDEINAQEKTTLKAKIQPYIQDDFSVIWEVDNPELAEINERGVFKALKAGIVTVFVSLAKNPSISNFKKIKINPVPEEVQIFGETSVAINCKQKFTSQVLPLDASQDVVWTVQTTPDVAEINQEGELIVHKKSPSGGVYILATSINDKIEPGALYVQIKNTPDNVIIQDWPQSGLRYDAQFQCTAYCNPIQAKQDVVWSVDKPENASIDAQTGLLTGHLDGVVKIRAHSSTNQDVYDEKEVLIYGQNPIAYDFPTDPWSTVLYFLNQGFDALQNAYKDTTSYIMNDNTFVGMTKTLNFEDGCSYEVIVVGEQQDVIAGTANQKAGLTFAFNNILMWPNESDIFIFSPNYNVLGADDSTWYRKIGDSGEERSNMIRWYLNYIFSDKIAYALGCDPSSSPLKKVVKNVSSIEQASWITYTKYQSNDLVFLPSLGEIYGEDGIRDGVTSDDIANAILYERLQDGTRYQYFDKTIQGDINPFLPSQKVEVLVKRYHTLDPKERGEKWSWWFRTIQLENSSSAGPTKYANMFFVTNANAYVNMNENALVKHAITPFFCL